MGGPKGDWGGYDMEDRPNPNPVQVWPAVYAFGLVVMFWLGARCGP